MWDVYVHFETKQVHLKTAAWDVRQMENNEENTNKKNTGQNTVQSCYVCAAEVRMCVCVSVCVLWTQTKLSDWSWA